MNAGAEEDALMPALEDAVEADSVPTPTLPDGVKECECLLSVIPWLCAFNVTEVPEADADKEGVADWVDLGALFESTHPLASDLYTKGMTEPIAKWFEVRFILSVAEVHL